MTKRPTLRKQAAAADLAAELLARRRVLRAAHVALAQDRWTRFRAAAAKRHWDRERGRMEQRFDLTLARGKWPGRVALVLRSGLWTFGLDKGVGREGGETCGLVSYVRAGPDSNAHPKALFDQTWYIEKNADLVGTAWAPLAHYLVAGDKEGRDPHPLFDLADYRSRHAVKVAASGLTALQHFIFTGAREGFNPHPLFDLRHYVGQSEEVAKSGENPLLHYLREGWRLGYEPHPLFSGAWYLQQNPDVAERGVPPLLHYVTSGAGEGRPPHPLFDTGWYAQRYRDATALGASPLADFLAHGLEGRRNPSLHFDSAFYLEQNPQTPENVHAILHYLSEGAFEGASPAPDFDELTYLTANPQAADAPISALEHWALSRTPKPEPGAGQIRAGGSDTGFFEQLRAARTKDASLYDVQAYRDLAAERRRMDQARKADVKVKPLKLIKLAEKDLEKAAAALAFPATATPRASIVIPAYNNLKFTLECLASLQAAEGLESAEIIVIDDASADATSALLATVPGLKVLTNAENLGFIRTCNRAAEAATGEFVIFLNNDVQVRSGWLAALLSPFDEETAVGATAPKMLFPDGRLQEAGARISVDGASEMIGLFDDPSLPRWNVRREVDYASGACLAVRRQVFADLGGFDITFAPAYCEDADLCFRLRERGLRIIYEPTSEIVHHLS
ncbi:MAG TPA: glycosyltransferase family 2 protein, partial [Phenylobacterium sp.]|nr:glycosyltransferase family 2 protein [Phenylobacterium sp.]